MCARETLRAESNCLWRGRGKNRRAEAKPSTAAAAAAAMGWGSSQSEAHRDLSESCQDPLRVRPTVSVRKAGVAVSWAPEGLWGLRRGKLRRPVVVVASCPPQISRSCERGGRLRGRRGRRGGRRRLRGRQRRPSRQSGGRGEARRGGARRPRALLWLVCFSSSGSPRAAKRRLGPARTGWS